MSVERIGCLPGMIDALEQGFWVPPEMLLAHLRELQERRRMQAVYEKLVAAMRTEARAEKAFRNYEGVPAYMSDPHGHHAAVNRLEHALESAHKTVVDALSELDAAAAATAAAAQVMTP